MKDSLKSKLLLWFVIFSLISCGIFTLAACRYISGVALDSACGSMAGVLNGEALLFENWLEENLKPADSIITAVEAAAPGELWFFKSGQPGRGTDVFDATARMWYYGFGYRHRAPDFSGMHRYLVFAGGRAVHLTGEGCPAGGYEEAAGPVIQYFLEQKNGALLYRNSAGEVVLAVTRCLPGRDAMLVGEMAKKQIQKPIYMQFITMAFLVLFLLVLLVLPLGTYITGRLTGPLSRLVEEMDKFSAENLGYQVDVASSGEVAVLARTFNQMSARLSDYYESLKKSVAELSEQKRELEEKNRELLLLHEERRQRQAELERANRKLEVLASTDALTGVLTRRYIFRCLEQEVGRAMSQGRPMALMIVDADNFKTINDTCGHPCGDRVLVEIAAVLNKSVRQCDLVGRYGGDEFLVILPGAGAGESMNVAGRFLRRAARISPDECCLPGRVTLSIGVAVLDSTGEACGKLEELLHRADEALLQAKRLGRNRAVVYSPDGAETVTGA